MPVNIENYSDTYRALKHLHEIRKERKADAKDPPPTFFIDFLDSPLTFYPGAKGKATVTIWNQTDTSKEILNPQVSLLAQVETGNTQASSSGSIYGSKWFIYKSRVVLFCHTKLLGDDFTLEPDARRKWEIDFAFPLNWTPADSTSAMDTRNLPPSCFFQDGSVLHRAVMSYCLQPQVTLWGRAKPFAIRSKPMKFKAFPDAVTGIQIGDGGSKHHLASNRLIGQEKSFSHSVHDVFSRHTPKVDVVIRPSLAAEQTVGSLFSIAITVEIGALSHSAIEIPQVEIRMISLKLVAITEGTAKRYNHIEIKPLDSYTATYTTDVPLDIISQDSVSARQVPSMINGQNGFSYQAEFQTKIPNDLTPSFKCLNMQRSYRLKAHVEVEFCGKVFKHDVKIENIKVMSDLAQPRAAAMQGHRVLEGWVNEVDPPPYDEDEDDDSVDVKIPDLTKDELMKE